MLVVAVSGDTRNETDSTASATAGSTEKEEEPELPPRHVLQPSLPPSCSALLLSSSVSAFIQIVALRSKHKAFGHLLILKCQTIQSQCKRKQKLIFFIWDYSEIRQRIQFSIDKQKKLTEDILLSLLWLQFYHNLIINDSQKS